MEILVADFGDLTLRKVCQFAVYYAVMCNF